VLPERNLNTADEIRAVVRPLHEIGGDRVILVTEPACYTRAVQVSDPWIVVNPRVDLKLVDAASAVTAVTVSAPVRGRSLQVTTIERTMEPGVFGALLVHAATNGALGLPTDLSADEHARLVDIGFLVPQDRVPKPVWFSCDLSDPLTELIPRRDRYARADVNGDLVVNPTLHHFGSAGPPPVVRGSVTLANRFQKDRAWIRVERPSVSAPCVYSYSPDTDGYVGALVPGGPVRNTLPADARRKLSEAGVVQTPDELTAQRNARERNLQIATRALHDDRYTLLRHLVTPLQLAAVRRYYREVIAEGFLPFGDAEWPNRYFSSRDPIGYFFHHQLTALVSEIAGERLKPSFSFFASYHPGSVLPPHRDREQCEYAMSLLVDYSPEPEDTSSWPIYVQPPGALSAVPVWLGIGDAVLYYGREVLHYRERFTQADYCSCWFLFYVPESFEGSLD
jgi:hypothetical protein